MGYRGTPESQETPYCALSGVISGKVTSKLACFSIVLNGVNSNEFKEEKSQEGEEEFDPS